MYLCSVERNKILMIKKIYILSAIFCAVTLMPIEVSAKIAAEPIMNFMPDDTNVKIEMEHKAVSVYGAQNMVLEIVSVTGKPIQKIKIERLPFPSIPIKYMSQLSFLPARYFPQSRRGAPALGQKAGCHRRAPSSPSVSGWMGCRARWQNPLLPPP